MEKFPGNFNEILQNMNRDNFEQEIWLSERPTIFKYLQNFTWFDMRFFKNCLELCTIKSGSLEILEFWLNFEFEEMSLPSYTCWVKHGDLKIWVKFSVNRFSSHSIGIFHK